MTAASLWLWAVDREGRYTMSEGGLDLFGFKPREALGRSALEVFKGHPDVVEALVRALSGQEARIFTAALGARELVRPFAGRRW